MWLVSMVATFGLLLGVVFEHFGMPRPQLPPRVAANDASAHDPLLGTSTEISDCYVDVVGHPELQTAGEVGDWLCTVLRPGLKQEILLVHPIRARVVASHADGCYLLTFEYDGRDQQDGGSPAREVYLPFLGISKRLFAGAEPQFVLSRGLLIGWTGVLVSPPARDGESY